MSENQKIISFLKQKSFTIQHRIDELDRMKDSVKSDLTDWDFFHFIYKCRTFTFINSLAASDRHQLGISIQEKNNPFPIDSLFFQWYEMAWQWESNRITRDSDLPF